MKMHILIFIDSITGRKTGWIKTSMQYAIIKAADHGSDVFLSKEGGS